MTSLNQLLNRILRGNTRELTVGDIESLIDRCQKAFESHNLGALLELVSPRLKITVVTYKNERKIKSVYRDRSIYAQVIGSLFASVSTFKSYKISTISTKFTGKFACNVETAVESIQTRNSEETFLQWKESFKVELVSNKPLVTEMVIDTKYAT